MEKGLNTQKRAITAEDVSMTSARDSTSPHNLTHPTSFGIPETSAGGQLDGDEEEEDDNDRTAHGMFPAKLIKKENRRNSFFTTCLNPSQPSPQAISAHERPGSAASTKSNMNILASVPGQIQDPVSAGLISFQVSITFSSGPRLSTRGNLTSF
jgi:hypothetical protein